MSKLDELRDYLRQVQRGEMPTDARLTHFMESWLLMRDGLGSLAGILDVNYDSEGLNARFEFADGKVYSVRIVEAKPKETL